MRETNDKTLVKLLPCLVLALAPFGAGAGEAIEDPMRPSWARTDAKARSAPTRDERFKVDTIVVSPERRVAIINGRSVEVGEWVNGARVIRIDADSVILELDGARFTIALAITDIKKASRHGG